jgi:NAD(P)-dependent dehydrogenase (short-subunit alcohol dehydrogenase family)
MWRPVTYPDAVHARPPSRAPPVTGASAHDFAVDAAGSAAAERHGRIDGVPLRRLGTPVEVAPVVAFLLGDAFAVEIAGGI